LTLFLVLADPATSKKREGIFPSHSLRVEEIVDFFRQNRSKSNFLSDFVLDLRWQIFIIKIVSTQ